MLEPHEVAQLNRIEATLVAVLKTTAEHNGFISAFKWMLAGVGAGLTFVLGKMGLS